MEKINVYIKTDSEGRIVKYSGIQFDGYNQNSQLNSEQIMSITLNKTGLINGELVELGYNDEYINEQVLNELRKRRTVLLEAFDIWEKAVVRGRETDSAFVMDWYNDLLDLKQEAFDNIPKSIQKYLY